MSRDKTGRSPGTGGLRALATSFGTRVLLAILFVVGVALLLVLFSLPRLLDGYFGSQERDNLQSRAELLTTLISSELTQAAVADSTHPILMPGAAPGLVQSTDVIWRTLEDGFVRELTEEVALADVTVEIAPEVGAEAVYLLTVSLPDEAADGGAGDRPAVNRVPRRRQPGWLSTTRGMCPGASSRGHFACPARPACGPHRPRYPGQC